MIRSFFSRLDVHMLEVVKGASLALAIRVLGTILGFAVSLLIASLLGAEGAGIYFLALSVATIAATISRVGFDNTVVRFVASHASAKECGSVLFVYRTALKAVALASLVVSLTLFISAGWVANVFFEKPYMEIPFRLAACAVFPLALAMIHAESLRGLKKNSSAEWIKTVFISIGSIVLIYPLVQLWGVNGAIAAYVCAVSVTALFAWYMWQRGWRKELTPGAVPVANKSLKPLFKSSWPLFGVALTGLVMQQSATIFLGAWGATADVGVFNVANRVSVLLLFPLMAMISIMAPKFAEMHRQGDLQGLKRLSHSSSKMLTLLVVPAALLFAYSAEWILGIFGSDFKDGTNVLYIILVGVVVNAVTGPVANLLMMSGHELVVRNTTILASALILLMCLLLIPKYGILGAAFATSLGMIVQNVSLAFMVHRYLGFSPVPIFKRALQ